MERKEYNGWTNYETWCVALWLDNSEGGQAYWDERADECLNNRRDSLYASESVEEIAVSMLADEIKDAHEEANPCADRADVFADLIGAALSEVDWREIARHYVEAVEEAAEAT